MPNNDNSYIKADNPVVEGDTNLFTRTWFRFLNMVATKIRILDGTLSTSASAGTATVLPAQPAGYMKIIDTTGVARKVPYYNE